MGKMMTVLVTATSQEVPLRAGQGATHKTKDSDHAAPAGVPGGAFLSELALNGFLQSFSSGLSESAHVAPAPRPPAQAPAVQPRDTIDFDHSDRDSAAAPAVSPRARPDAPTARPVEDARPSNTAEIRHSPDTAPPARAPDLTARPDAAAARPLTAQVTQEAPILISQPASALSARSAVTAQAQAQAQPSSSAPAGGAASGAAGDGTTQSTGTAPQQALLHQHPKGRSGRQGTNSQPSTAPSNAGAKVVPGAQTPQAIGATQGLNASAAGLANAGQGGQGGQLARQPIFPSTANTVLASTSGADFAAPRAGGPPPLPRPPVPIPPRLVTNQVSVQIQKAVGQGVDQIRIQLKPADLGRVDVKLDVAPDGRVNVAVSVENPDTLELLQRDARALQNALQDAGLRTDSDSLQFTLKGHGREFGGEDASTPDENDTLADQQAQPDQPTDLANGQPGDLRVDIRV